MVGERLGHYSLLEKVGEGGMGVVYRARDEHLGRDVAIKVLPAGTLGDEAARKRFRKEALALSKLNHPNIETVHDFDTQEGVDFLVMEYIAGQTLSDKLVGGGLAEKEIARVGMQVSEALAAAHERGVVHRDIKPGNIRLTREERVKVLDFGLAKLLQPFSLTAATESVSETGVVAGTLPYMAPEQLRGEAVDARADIYSLGVVLYELATRRRPFQETLSTALTDAILHKPAPPPGRLRSGLSAELEHIILKCLEKDPENRYQSAKELCVDLRRLSAPTSSGGAPRQPVSRRARRVARQRISSLAVLPLANLSRDPEQEYFADGMTEALITDLAKISALKVISRTTVMRYRGSEKPLPEIARELSVDALVEGSVLRAGDQVRITAQLIHGATDEHLWAESYQRPLQDVLALQAEVARAIAQEIRVKLTPQERARLTTIRRVNPEAHDAFLKGCYFWSRWSREGLEKGVQYFQQAIEQDPTYAPTYAGLAQCFVFLGYWDYLLPPEVYPKAKAAALRALELDDSLADAHCALGAVHWFYDWDPPACERELQRALELNPSDATAHLWYAVFLAVVAADFERAIAEARRAQELDPLSVFISACLGWIHFWARQYEQAIAQARKTLELDPNSPQAYYVLGSATMEMGRIEDSIAAHERAVDLLNDPLSLGFLAVACAVAGQTDKAHALLAKLKEKAAREHISAYRCAWVYLALGQRAEALEWLEKSCEERDAELYWLRFSPGYESVQDDPRVRDLLRRLNLPQK